MDHLTIALVQRTAIEYLYGSGMPPGIYYDRRTVLPGYYAIEAPADAGASAGADATADADAAADADAGAAASADADADADASADASADADATADATADASVDANADADATADANANAGDILLPPPAIMHCAYAPVRILPKTLETLTGNLRDLICNWCSNLDNMVVNDEGVVKRMFCQSCRSCLAHAQENACECGAPRFVDELGVPAPLCSECYKEQRRQPSRRRHRSRSSRR